MKRKFLIVFAALMLLVSGFMPLYAAAQEEVFLRGDRVDELIAEMTLEEKVCQLFFVRPEDFSRTDKVTAGSTKLMRAFEKFPVGGIILFPVNIRSSKQLLALNQDMQAYAEDANGIGLLIGVDEEGGGVSRVARKLKLDDAMPAMSAIGETKDPNVAYEAGSIIGKYLKDLGFTLDFAPVADVRTDVDKAEITLRSFGYEPELVSSMTASFVRGLQEERVLSVLKHFPGHGSASGNSHTGSAVSTRTVSQWKTSEWLPFQAGIDAGVHVVLMSHLTAATVDPDSPASLSYTIVTDLLRGELEFDGIIITDALRMDAITKLHGSGEACVRALLAGCDMLLLPYNFSNGYHGVMKAIEEGRLTEERIEESVRRILLVKLDAGLVK